MSGSCASSVKSRVESLTTILSNLQAAVVGLQEELEKVQEECPHSEKESIPEYDFVAHKCPDCTKTWTTRR